MSDRAAWRLLRDGDAGGAWNMAVDEAVLDGVAMGSSPPTLRFYGWSPPCLSLGYFQRFEVVDTDACRRMGVEIVRRPTGGRAILHDRELTYSIVLPAAVLGHDAGILPSYHRISRGLQAGLRRLGVATSMAPESAAAAIPEHGAICFDRPSAHEILLSGRKLVGSAQMRRAGAILQHGSILIEPRIERLAACLHRRAEDGGAQVGDLRASVIGLAEVGVSDNEVLRNAIAAGVREEFEMKLLDGTLTAAEATRAKHLMSSKYRSPDWTERPLAASPDTTRTR